MPNFSQSDINAYYARQHAKGLKAECMDAAEKESDLHEAIINECNRRGWCAVHSRMDRATTVQIGTPDFIIFADAGRVFAVECKSKTGKLSTEQLATQAWLKRLGHTLHVVRSFREFIEVIDGKAE